MGEYSIIHALVHHLRPNFFLPVQILSLGPNFSPSKITAQIWAQLGPKKNTVLQHQGFAVYVESSPYDARRGIEGTFSELTCLEGGGKIPPKLFFDIFWLKCRTILIFSLTQRTRLGYLPRYLEHIRKAQRKFFIVHWNKSFASKH